MQRRLRVLVAAIGAMLTVASCVGLPPAEMRRSLAFLELPPQKLRPGECAMFLWAQDKNKPRRILMVWTDATETQLARVKLWKRIEDFEQTRRSGRPVLGFYPQQTFERFGIEIALDLSVEENERLSRGAVVPRGTLSMTSPEGWSTLIPVAGLVGCEEPGR